MNYLNKIPYNEKLKLILDIKTILIFINFRNTLNPKPEI